MHGYNITKILLSFAFRTDPSISLTCKLVPVQYREYKYGLFARSMPTLFSCARCSSLQTADFSSLYFHSYDRELTVTRLTWALFRLTSIIFRLTRALLSVRIQSVVCSAVCKSHTVNLARCPVESKFTWAAIFKRQDRPWFQAQGNGSLGVFKV